MAFIRYTPNEEIPERHRVPDRDNIIRVHGVNPPVMKNHYDFYVTLMHRPGPLARSRREMIALTVSGLNGCRY